MADLRLYSGDERVTALPDLCMQCGEPAALFKRKRFSWFPSWVWILLFVCGLVPFAIVAAVTTKRRTVEAPLCEAHKNHWLARQLLVVGSLFGILLLGGVTWAVSLDNNARGDDLGGLLCVGSVVMLILWVILAVVVQFNSIRAREITDRDMTLVGVAQEFVNAYQDEWHVAPERLDDLARESWNDSRHTPSQRPTSEDDRIRPEDDRQPPPDTFREGAPQ